MKNNASENSNSNSPRKIKKIRNGKIDLLKFLFSIVVAMYHFGNSVEYPEKMFGRGYFAVEFFFIVSGYLFAKSLSKFDNKENINVMKESLLFMKKKYISFFHYHILLYIITVICLINYYALTFEQVLVKIFNSIPDLLLLQMFDTKPLQWFGHEWYLSAMIIIMFILTPIMIKFRKPFSWYAAPVLSLTALTFIFNKHGNIDTVREWYGFAYSGLIRAFADISLGCVCYAVSESGIIERMKKGVLIPLEILSYYLIFFYMNSIYSKSLEFSLIYLLAFGIMISFSRKASVKFLNNQFVYFLGKISLPIYLCHIGVRSYILTIEWEYGYWSYLGIFLLTTLIVSLIFLFAADGIMSLIKNRKMKKA